MLKNRASRKKGLGGRGEKGQLVARINTREIFFHEFEPVAKAQLARAENIRVQPTYPLLIAKSEAEFFQTKTQADFCGKRYERHQSLATRFAIAHKKDGAVRQMTPRLGLTGLTHSEVLEGVKEGDQVATQVLLPKQQAMTQGAPAQNTGTKR